MAKSCKEGNPRRLVWRCLPPLKVRQCKHGARLASGRCPKGKRGPKARMSGPINYSAKLRNAHPVTKENARYAAYKAAGGSH